MFARLGQLARHLSRPLPNYTHHSAAAFRPSIMTSDKKTIHTAACLIIGDEVLGGKVS